MVLVSVSIVFSVVVRMVVRLVMGCSVWFIFC